MAFPHDSSVRRGAGERWRCRRSGRRGVGWQETCGTAIEARDQEPRQSADRVLQRMGHPSLTGAWRAGRVGGSEVANGRNVSAGLLCLGTVNQVGKKTSPKKPSNLPKPRIWPHSKPNNKNIRPIQTDRWPTPFEEQAWPDPLGDPNTKEAIAWPSDRLSHFTRE